MSTGRGPEIERFRSPGDQRDGCRREGRRSDPWRKDRDGRREAVSFRPRGPGVRQVGVDQGGEPEPSRPEEK